MLSIVALLIYHKEALQMYHEVWLYINFVFSAAPSNVLSTDNLCLQVCYLLVKLTHIFKLCHEFYVLKEINFFRSSHHLDIIRVEFWGDSFYPLCDVLASEVPRIILDNGLSQEEVGKGTLDCENSDFFQLPVNAKEFVIRVTHLKVRVQITEWLIFLTLLELFRIEILLSNSILRSKCLMQAVKFYSFLGEGVNSDMFGFADF